MPSHLPSRATAGGADSLHDHILEVASKVHHRCQTASDLDSLIEHLTTELERLRTTPETSNFQSDSPQDVYSCAQDGVTITAQGAKSLPFRTASPLFLPSSPPTRRPRREASQGNWAFNQVDNNSNNAQDIEWFPSIKRNRQSAISESSESVKSSGNKHSRRKRAKAVNTKNQTTDDGHLELKLPLSSQDTLRARVNGSSCATAKTGPLQPLSRISATTPVIVSPLPDTLNPDVSTEPDAYCPQLLKDALARLPEEPEVDVPEDEEILTHKQLKNFFRDPAATFTQTCQGVLRNNEVLDIIMSNPQRFDWAPVDGRHGVLTFLSNEESQLANKSYPIMTKEKSGWKYGGEYKIGVNIPFTEEIWRDFPEDVQDRLKMMISTSAWGSAWLQKRGWQSRADAQVLRNDLDFPKAISKKTLLVTWVVVEFEGYSLETYEKLAQAWNPQKSKVGTFWKEGKRSTMNSRRWSWIKSPPRCKENMAPELLVEVLDGLNPHHSLIRMKDR